jgi:hypothetical protein
MKTQLFKTAWNLFKKFNMTFSQALIEAWKEVKKEMIVKQVQQMNLSELKERMELTERLKPFKTTFYELREVLTTKIDNKGAVHFYGAGTYNGD